ncbi:MAG: glutamate 5-kinase [Gammaproteobacteria bacterium]|nr:glutamate 5-kinase [Gammaproteobacteria bacterium]
MMKRDELKKTNRWVVKLGSSLLTNKGLGLKTETLDNWVSQIMALRNDGKEVVLVSSGAVAEGINRLKLGKRPPSLHELQAVAAVGQMGLIQAYESCFQKYNAHTAQILITHDEISNRSRYLNARSTLRTLLGMNVVPIVNENDTVATDEIQFGDNDTLAGLVSNLVEADILVILTDQSGLYDQDPGKHDDAKLISYAEAGDKALEGYAGEVGTLGRGGMLTKLRAAEIAAKSGTTTLIANGMDENVLIRLENGEDIGTLLDTKLGHVTARKQWLAGQSRLVGELVLDEGAAKVLKEGGRSLLAVGVVSVKGDFQRGEIVRCLDLQGQEVARGLINYNNEEIQKIMGQPSHKIESLLGYIDEEELIHRDNMVIV